MADLTELQRAQIAVAAAMLHVVATGAPISTQGRVDAKRFVENLMRIWEGSAAIDSRDLWFAEWQLVLPKDAREAWPGGQHHDTPGVPGTVNKQTKGGA